MFTFKKYDNQMVFLAIFFFIFLKHNWHKLMRKADIWVLMYRHSKSAFFCKRLWIIFELEYMNIITSRHSNSILLTIIGWGSIITAHHLLWGHCVNSEVIVLVRGIFRSSQRKIPRSKNNHRRRSVFDMGGGGGDLVGRTGGRVSEGGCAPSSPAEHDFTNHWN